MYSRQVFLDKWTGQGKLASVNEALATGQSDIHCKIKETLLIRELKPALNENVDR